MSVLVFFFFGGGRYFLYSSITTPQVGKKIVTGVQVVTASQVQIIGCRLQAISSCVCVCVAVTTLGNMESDQGAQSSSYQKA